MPGLRREEVAHLAGPSADYYIGAGTRPGRPALRPGPGRPRPRAPAERRRTRPPVPPRRAPAAGRRARPRRARPARPARPAGPARHHPRPDHHRPAPNPSPRTPRRGPCSARRRSDADWRRASPTAGSPTPPSAGCTRPRTTPHHSRVFTADLPGRRRPARQGPRRHPPGGHTAPAQRGVRRASGSTGTWALRRTDHKRIVHPALGVIELTATTCSARTAGNGCCGSAPRRAPRGPAQRRNAVGDRHPVTWRRTRTGRSRGRLTPGGRPRRAPVPARPWRTLGHLRHP
ncbi:hypothetical protein LT493_44690 [Streptomyces tricolor]|nr:hypothetical protein [Streptomyces tricolor]